VVKEMNAQAYIESGIVLDYCLGLVTGQDKADFEQALKLYPELDQELKAVQEGLDKYAATYSKSPLDSTKDKVMNALENLLLEKQMNLSKLPVINKFSDHKAWMAAVASLLPNKVEGEPFMHVLTATDSITQVLVMSATDIPDEVHTDVWESFIVLEGECECYIGTDTVVRLKAGGYLEIPMHEHHDVKIISDYVVGIMQRIAA